MQQTIHIRSIAVSFRHLLSLLLVAWSSAWAAGGDLDRSFGAGAGYVTYGQPYEAHWKITGAVALADGRAVIGGYLDLKYLVRRYFPDGRLDPSFGNLGTEEVGEFARASTSLNLESNPSLYLDALGRIVVRRTGLVRRLNADGRYDSSYQPSTINVEHSLDMDSRWRFEETFLPLADGRMIVVTTQIAPNATDFISVRYFLADGSPDTSRGGVYGERLVGPSSGGRYVSTHAAVQADGKLLISAIWVQASSLGLAVIRLNADGSLDAGFGAGGVLLIGQDLGRVHLPSLSVNADGKIALGYFVYGADVAPGAPSYFVVNLLLPDGRTDTSQPMAGRISLVVPDRYGYPVFQEWFRIVLAPSQLAILARSFFWQMNLQSGGPLPAVSDYAPAEVNSAYLDDQLGGGYLWRFKVYEPRHWGRLGMGYQNSVALAYPTDAISGQPAEMRYSEMAESWTAIVSARSGTDGRITALGLDDEFYGFQRSGLYRFLANGVIDQGFGLGGVVGTFAQVESRLLDTFEGGATVFGKAAVGSSYESFLLRYDANGQADTSFANGGKIALAPRADYDALRLPSGTLAVLGVSWDQDNDFGFQRYHAAGNALGQACGGRPGVGRGVGKFSLAARSDDGLLAVFASADSILGPSLRLFRCPSNGEGGWLSANPLVIGEHFSYVRGVNLLPNADGGAVVALALGGNVIASQPRFLIVLLRLKPDGTLDTSFGDAGKVYIPVEDQSVTAREELTKFGLVRQLDGQLVVARNQPLGSGTAIVVGRYFSDGKPDGSFGVNGNHEVMFRLGGKEWVADLAQATDGKLILVGQSGRRGLMVRLYGEATPPPASPVPVIEFFNTDLNHYFSTGGSGEIAAIEAGAAGPGWQRTGLSFKAYAPESGIAPGAQPVCRFYGTPGRGPNSHFYTVDPIECELVKRDPGWTYEGIAFYLFPPTNGQCAGGMQAVYRAYNLRFAQNDSNHRYTTDAAVYAQMQAQGWAGEGVKFCGAGTPN